MTNLPYHISHDTCRCYGTACPERDSCLRFTVIESDKLIRESCRISYSDNMCGVSGQFNGVYKIELEKW